jgi:hypothetical protein
MFTVMTIARAHMGYHFAVAVSTSALLAGALEGSGIIAAQVPLKEWPVPYPDSRAQVGGARSRQHSLAPGS